MNAPDGLSSLSNEPLQEVLRQMRAERLFKQACINGQDPSACLCDVLERLPLQPARRIDELRPHRRAAPTISSAPCGTGSR